MSLLENILHKKEKLFEVSFIKHFFENKLDPNFVYNKELFPLFFAEGSKSAHLSEYILLFLQHGFQVNTKCVVSYNGGNAMIHFLARRNFLSSNLLKLMIEYKANTNLKNENGDTVLNLFANISFSKNWKLFRFS
eukprot:TRINITY_DN17398_c0_g1_i1.p1 TRINITY_DN17398_c0_g1~~TRINITY_DN17398_c0_g1_i1.p1  ORF type:complete len:135 (+),score=30.19 TRINITY_DN17398_c0_g1_i1:277-681(+)